MLSKSQRIDGDINDNTKVYNKIDVAENCFEAILEFNNDMKTLAMNAFQL